VNKPGIIIAGAGFGGLYAARSLARLPVDITVLDRRNYFLFQPLLYQVATGGLSPGDIASPIRAVLNKYTNVSTFQTEVQDLDPAEKRVRTTSGDFKFDYFILATGSDNNYFGNDDWARYAPGLKNIENATDIRRKILKSFEMAEEERDPNIRKRLLRFIIIGGGPTGVELSGAIAELSRVTMKNDFRYINPAEAEILLLEGSNRLLAQFPDSLAAKAVKSLKKLGVQIRTNALVTAISENSVTIKYGHDEETIEAGAVVWAAGVKVNNLGKYLTEKLTLRTDRSGRILVEPDLSIAEYPDIFVIGDLANYSHQTGSPLPALAPVAMQQGKYLAKAIKARLDSRQSKPFHYINKGSLAVIGRNSAVADFGKLRFSGFPAWIIWLFVHIAYLIEYDNKLLVLFQWAWDYFTRKRGARLITWEDETIEMKAKSGKPD